MKMVLNIGEVRRHKKIRQADLAVQVGISREHLSAVENNRETPSINLLEKIAAALGVSITEILSDQPAEDEGQGRIENRGGAGMTKVWYVCDGQVEEYSGQEANWDNSVIVCAESAEAALIKVLQYYLKRLECSKVIHGGKTILAIA